jgi:16S rRNA (guanine966-N2)-methyltransferase
MGIEALSRGAASCTLVYSDREATGAIARHLEQPALTGATVEKRDVFAVLRAERARGRAWDLVLCDPPYESWAVLEERLAAELPPVLATDGVLVVETDGRTEPVLPLALVTSRRYGSARITIFRAP